MPGQRNWEAQGTGHLLLSPSPFSSVGFASGTDAIFGWIIFGGLG